MTILDECRSHVQVSDITMGDMMKIGMVAAMVIGMVVLNGCGIAWNYVPHEELNGKILVDPSNGKKYKLEWLEGQGDAWRFLEEYKDPQDTSKSEWFYVAPRIK